MLWSTGAAVRRESFYGDRYDEELDMSPASIRLERLNDGAPLLADHDAYSIRNVIGSVVPNSVKITKDGATARVRFSENNPAADVIWRDVVDGHLRNVSVGYQVHKYEVTKRDEGVDLWRAVDWTPFEISVVPIGADNKAKFRSILEGDSLYMPGTDTAADTTAQRDSNVNLNIVVDDKRTAVADPTDKHPAAVQPVGPSETEIAARLEGAREAARAEERKRVADITALTRKLSLGDDFAAKHIDAGSDMNTAREAALEAVASRTDAVQTRGTVEVPLGARDERTTLREGMVGALLHRGDSMRFKLEGPATDYRGLTLIEMARMAIEAAGERTKGMDRGEIATRAFMSTSDFPYILATTANKSLLAAFDAAERTYEPIVRRVSVPDFNLRYEVRMGENPGLDEVNEHGEFKRGSVTESRESYKIKTYGKVLGVTRKTIINDDMSAFTRIPQQWGNSVAQKQSDIVWALITANGAMADGVALFHSTHKNLGTAGAPSVDTLAAGFTAMAKQTGLDGTTILNIRPKYLICPVSLAYGTVAKLFSPITPEAVANTRPAYMSMLQVIAEPRLDTASAYNWYLAADPSVVGGLLVAYLDGQEAPFVDSRVGFDVDGVELKCRIDFGAAVTEYRGLYKNPATS